MKYRNLLLALQELTEEQLNMNVVIYDSNNKECYSAEDTYLLSEHPDKDYLSNILNDDFPMICILKNKNNNYYDQITSKVKHFLSKKYDTNINLTDQLRNYIKEIKMTEQETMDFLNSLSNKLKNLDEQIQIANLYQEEFKRVTFKTG